MEIVIGSTSSKEITRFVLVGATGPETRWEFITYEGNAQSTFTVITTDKYSSADNVVDYSSSTIGIFFPIGSKVLVRAKNNSEISSWYEFKIGQVTSFHLYYALSSDTSTNGETIEGIPESSITGNTVVTSLIAPTINRSVIVSDALRVVYRIKLAANYFVHNDGTFELFATAYDGTPPYTYTWTPTTGLTFLAANRVTCNPNETITYRIEARDKLGYRTYKNVTVLFTATVPNSEPLVVFAGNNRSAGLNATVYLLGATVNGGVPPYSYLWTCTGSTTITNANSLTSATFKASAVGLYEVVLTVTDSIGNISADSLTVDIAVSPPPVQPQM